MRIETQDFGKAFAMAGVLLSFAFLLAIILK
jgi:hypothetical protein